jgi:hypothetical protein
LDDAGVTEVIDPLLQIKALQELARKLPPGSKRQSHLFWENDHGVAGATLTTDGRCLVYLFGAEQEVETVADAGELLKRILADEVVSVRAYANEVLVYEGLAPASHPSAGFSRLDGHSSSRDMPDIDYVTIETWSTGLIESE